MEKKIYVTKYALTGGIIEKEARIQVYIDGSSRAFVDGNYSSYRIGSEAFCTKE